MGDDDKLDRTAARLMDDWRETNESWTQLIERIDAALRRAKAEGIRMVETYARACVHERAVQLDGFTGSSGMAGVIRGKQSEADRIVDWAYACAAQIEEGEDLK